MMSAHRVRMLASSICGWIDTYAAWAVVGCRVMTQSQIDVVHVCRYNLKHDSLSPCNVTYSSALVIKSSQTGGFAATCRLSWPLACKLDDSMS